MVLELICLSRSNKACCFCVPITASFGLMRFYDFFETVVTGGLLYLVYLSGIWWA